MIMGKGFQEAREGIPIDWDWNFQRIKDEDIDWGIIGFRNSGQWIKKRELLDWAIEIIRLRNWNHWRKKLESLD